MVLNGEALPGDTIQIELEPDSDEMVFTPSSTKESGDDDA
jgi:hypothetical protein